MTRLVRFRWFSGQAADARRYAPGRALGVALVASLGVLAIGGMSTIAPIGAVFAQTPGTAGQTLFSLFDVDSVDPKTDGLAKLAAAIRQAKVPRECALGELTIYTPKGEELFQKALSGARRDALLLALERQGLGVAGRLLVKEEVGSLGKFDVGYSPPRDDKPPKLHTTSVPPKGSKVKAGDRIKVTMVARDDTEPKHWQTGIKTIQLVAESEGGRFIASENYDACTDPRERRVEATYVVPANPPPIVRLAALAEDHVGLIDTDVGDFPTGDWYGTIEFSTVGVTSGVRLTIKDHINIALDYDGRGNLQGTLTGDRSFNQQGHPNCNWDVIVPNKLRGKLIGSYTPGAEAMSLQLVEPVVAPAPRKDCPGGGYIYSGDSIHETPQFKSVLRSPRATQDGTFRSSMEWVTGSYTHRISLTLRRAEN